MTNSMIRTRGLTRTFTIKRAPKKSSDRTSNFSVKNDTVEAVRGLDLDVERGEMVALLGPNGAGKSTTLRMLTTLIPPTSGTAEVAGHDVTTGQRHVRRNIGYIGQGNSAAHAQRGRNELISHGRAYGLSRSGARERAGELISSLDLEAVADRNVSALSGGQRRRLDIAMGLMHEPDLLFLDEPSTGLDPQNRANLQDHIRKLRADRGTTVVLTTHYLDEADVLAERVIVIDHGAKIADDSPARLKAQYAGDRIVLSVSSIESARDVASQSLGIGPDADVDVIGTSVTIQAADGARHVPGLLRHLDDVGVEVTGVEVSRPTLDDVFLNLTGRSLREDGAPANDDDNTIAEEIAA